MRVVRRSVSASSAGEPGGRRRWCSVCCSAGKGEKVSICLCLTMVGKVVSMAGTFGALCIPLARKRCDHKDISMLQ